MAATTLSQLFSTMTFLPSLSVGDYSRLHTSFLDVMPIWVTPLDGGHNWLYEKRFGVDQSTAMLGSM